MTVEADGSLSLEWLFVLGCLFHFTPLVQMAHIFIKDRM